jgi:hypothetical protein
MEPDLSELKDFKLVRAVYISTKIIDEYFGVAAHMPFGKDILTAIDPATILPIESYTFRNPTSGTYWFNITFVEGRIIITGDCGDNVFVVGGTNEELKNWLINLDMNYALGKSKQGREYYDSQRAVEIIKDILITNYYMDDKKSGEIIRKLDFENIYALGESLHEYTDIYTGDLRLLDWSPMQKMQYKQLVFAGKFLRVMVKEEKHEQN